MSDSIIETKSMEFVQVVDWQSKTRWKLPRMGEGNYLRWLFERGYELMEQQQRSKGRN